MVFARKSKPKGERVVRKKQPDGTVKEYRYPKYTPRKRDISDTIEALIDAYKSSPEWLALSIQTKRVRTGYLKPMAEIGHIPVSSVKRRDIIQIHDTMRTSRGDGAAGGFLAAAAALFRWAVDKEWIEHSPVDKIKPAPSGHHRAWTVAEADAAEAGLPEQLRRVIVLARHTGQRRGDLCAMRWTDYDGRAIRITQIKTKPGAAPVRLVIPATPTLKRELDGWRVGDAGATILTNAHGRPWRPESLSHLLPKALERIGMGSDLNVHGLRKLAAAELANAGCSAGQIAAITGHRTLGMVELYTRSADQERMADAAMARLQLFYNSQPTEEKTNENNEL